MPPETWNRLGTKVLPRLRSGDGLAIDVDLSVRFGAEAAERMEAELERILEELGLGDRVRIRRS